MPEVEKSRSDEITTGARQTEPTQVAEQIAETQTAIAEHTETPPSERDEEWRNQFQTLTMKLETLDQNLASILTKLETPTIPPNPEPNEPNDSERVLEIDPGELDQPKPKTKTRGRNPKRLQLKKFQPQRG